MNNLKTLSFVPGWLGGHYCLDGQTVNFTDSWKGTKIYFNGKRYRAELQNVVGQDEDMGNYYPWQLTHIGVMDGEILPRFLSAKLLLQKFKVQVEDPRDDGYHTLGH